MLDLVARLLVALSVAAGAGGLATAQDHASPGGSPNAVAAIEAIIARLSDAAVQAQSPTSGQPDTTGLDRATGVANDHAAAGLEKAKEAAGNAGGPAAAQAPVVDTPPVAAPPVDTPPVDVPAAHGPPATHPPVAVPPVPVPPVPAPPVDAPGQGNRP